MIMTKPLIVDWCQLESYESTGRRSFGEGQIQNSVHFVPGIELWRVTMDPTEIPVHGGACEESYATGNRHGDSNLGFELVPNERSGR